MLALSLALLALSACGLTASHRNPGFVDLPGASLLAVGQTTTVSIGPTVLRLVASQMDDDPEARALLQGLQGVQVHHYPLEQGSHRAASYLGDMQTSLRVGGWLPVALVRNEGDTVHLLMKGSEQAIVGLVLLVQQPDQAVVVNVMGNLQPEHFAAAMKALEIEAASTVEVAAS